jgi:hypothetical protein
MTSREAIQALFEEVVGQLITKYGNTVQTEFSLAKADPVTGRIVGLVVGFNFLGSADPDGVRPRIRKEIDVW